MLTEEERRILWSTASEAIEDSLTGRELRMVENAPPALLIPCGAFVTLHHQGKLRGCIGYIEPVKPLIQTVQEVAIKAAFEDPRFPPLTENEHVQIEISVLSPPKRVLDISSIEVGKDGLIIELGPRRGVLLPQVAAEYSWDRETFLENTAMKAGLPPDAWRHPAVKIYRFSAEIFGYTLRPHEEETR